MRKQPLTHLTSEDVGRLVSSTSIILIPFGSCEQHGPHLPLATDTIIAEQISARIVREYGDRHDLVIAPTVPLGLSPEHQWAPGTVSVSSSVATDLLRCIVGQLASQTGARRFVIVNGHGGNRGLLESVVRDLGVSNGAQVIAIHPLSGAQRIAPEATADVHAGLIETSVMLALAPNLVHMDRLPTASVRNVPTAQQIQSQVLDRFVTWPWDSADPLISQDGVIGADPRKATADLGERVLQHALNRTEAVIARLHNENPPAPPTQVTKETARC